MNEKILIKTILAGNPVCVYTCVCQWYDIENLYQQREKLEEEEIDIDPEQLTILTRTEWNMSQARGDSVLEITANRETLIHRASEKATFARPVDITNDSVVDGNSSTTSC